MNEKGLHTNLVSSGEAYLVASKTQRPKVTTKDGLKLRHFNFKRFMAVPDLG